MYEIVYKHLPTLFVLSEDKIIQILVGKLILSINAPVHGPVEEEENDPHSLHIQNNLICFFAFRG